MDFATFNGLITLSLLLIFLGLIAWTFSRKRKAYFERMAQQIFDNDEQQNHKHKEDPSL